MARLKFIALFTISHGGNRINKGTCPFDVACGTLKKSSNTYVPINAMPHSPQNGHGWGIQVHNFCHGLNCECAL